jgi:hypothetical protein
MATKKKKAAKRKVAKAKAADQAAEVEFTDEQIFDIFGVGTETASLPMRKFISGQRLINGRLYVAIDKILDHLTNNLDRPDPDLEEAKRLNEEVPGRPPACNPGGG